MIEIEMIVGTMGIDRLLADKIPKYTKTLFSAASSTLSYYKEGAQVFADSNKPRRLPYEATTLEEFQDIVAKLQAEDDYEGSVDNLMTWPEELRDALQVQIADVKWYLLQQIPTSTVSGAFSSKTVPPSDSDLYRFMWQVDLCGDIRRFVDLLNSGGISPIESSLMRTLFPMTHDYLIVEVLDHMLTASVSGDIDAWEGSWRKQAASGLFGVPLNSFEDLLVASSGAEPAGPGRPKGPGTIQVATPYLTGSQALELRTLERS